MGDHYQRSAVLLVQGKQLLNDILRRVLIEVPRRFVGKQDLWSQHKARASATRCCSPPES